MKARARSLTLVVEVELQKVAKQNQDEGQQQDDVERGESPQEQGGLALGIAENGREVEGLLHHREQQQNAHQHRQRNETSSRFARFRCHLDAIIIGPRKAKSKGIRRGLLFAEFDAGVGTGGLGLKRGQKQLTPPDFLTYHPLFAFRAVPFFENWIRPALNDF